MDVGAYGLNIPSCSGITFCEETTWKH